MGCLGEGEGAATEDAWGEDRGTETSAGGTTQPSTRALQGSVHQKGLSQIYCILAYYCWKFVVIVNPISWLWLKIKTIVYYINSILGGYFEV